MNVSKTNGVKLFALIAVLAMVFACAAVVVSDNGVDAANDTQNWGGQTLKGEQTFTGVNINVNENLTIDGKDGKLIINSGNFTVAKGVTITVKNGGSITVNNGLVTIDGTVKVTGDASTFTITGTNDTNIPTFKDAGVVVNGSLSFEKGAKFVGTTGNSGIGKILVKNGANLEVSGNATTINNMAVYIAVGGTFAFSGKTESASMIVSSYGTGEHFTLAQAEIETNAASKSKNLSDLTFTTTSKNLNGYLAAAEPQATLVKEFALNVNGSIDNLDTVTLTGELYKSTTSQNTTTYGPDTVTYYASVDAAKHANRASGTASVAYNDLVMGKVIIDSLAVKEGAGLKIGTDSDNTVYVLVNGDISVKEVSKEDFEALGGTSSQTTLTDIEPLVGIYDGSVAEVVGKITANYGSIIANDGGPDALGTIAVNGGTITLEDFSDKVVASFFGAYYTDKDDTAYIADLVTTIDAAVAAGEDEVTMYAATNSEKDTNGYGGYTISANLTIPDGITLNINNALIVEEGVTLTFTKDSEPTLGSYGKIFVNGTVVDNSTYLADEEPNMYFQVKIVDEDAEVNTYTSLENALSTTTSGTIYLYNKVVVSGTMTIPENVTVMYDTNAAEKGISFEDENATLVINGTLYLKTTDELVPGDGTVTVNNVLAAGAAITPGTSGVGTYPSIYGVYYQAALVGDDDDPEYVITSAAVAATNSANVSGGMTVYGKVAMGTVTFAQGEDYQLPIVIMNGYNGGTDKAVATGDVTLVGGATFDTENGAFTGTVTSETSAGATTVSFDKSMGSEVKFVSVETMEGTTTDMILAQKGSSAIIGTITVSAGEVTINAATNFNSPATVTGSTDPQIGKLAVASGATLNVEATVELGAYSTATELAKVDNLNDLITDNMTFDVAGTVNVDDKGNLKWGYTVITGTLNVLKGGQLDLTMVQNDGTIVIAEDAASAEVELMVINGKLTGNMGISADSLPFDDMGIILVMPGADMADGTIMWNETNNETDAEVSEAYINGELYATIYAANNSAATIADLVKYADVTGLKKEGAKYYTDAAMNNELTDADLTNAKIGTSPAFYIVLQPATVTGKISAVQGMTIYIDGLGLKNFESEDGYALTVGDHYITVQVTPGYSATPVVTFNGQTVTDGKITITGDMKEFTLLASGDVSVDTGATGGDDGMGLTEILLVILVILIVVMAIMVALRLMRS